MGSGTQTSFLTAVREHEKETWRCDPEKCHASFIYHRVFEGGNFRYWDTYVSVEIRPYPNPFGFGGMWGGGGWKTKKELNKALRLFKERVKFWEKHGLTRIEIKQKPDEVRPDRELVGKVVFGKDGVSYQMKIRG